MFTAKYNSNNLAKDEINGGYLLTDINWRNVVTKDKISSLMGSHGVLSGPTYARYRLITLAGIAKGESRSHLQNYINELGGIFDIPLDLNNSEKEFELTDPGGTTWKINARVQSPILFEYDEDNFIASRFRISLFCKDPVFHEDQLNEQLGQEGILFGFILNKGDESRIFGIKLGKVFDDQGLGVNLTATGNVGSRLIVTIDILSNIDTPHFRITNTSTGKFFGLSDISLDTGDQIIIDGLNQTAKKNGENILANREPGSSWLEVYKTQHFIASDSDIEKDFNIKYEWQNALL